MSSFLFITPHPGAVALHGKSLEEIGLPTTIFTARPNVPVSEIFDLLIMDLDRPLRLLDKTELIEGKHHLVHLFYKVYKGCRKEIPIVFTSPLEGGSLSDFGLTNADTPNPHIYIPRLAFSTSAFAAEIAKFFNLHKPPPTA